MPRALASPTPLRLFLIFSRIGLTSFGGGLSGWLLREFVTDRAWIDEEAFLNGLSLAQALPGVNVTNMAVWIGSDLAGVPGALASVAGIVAPPAVAIVALAAGIERLSGFSATTWALDGAAAAAVGLSASMAITVTRRVPRRPLPWVVLGATFAAVGLLHWPLLPVVVAMGTLSVAAEWRRLGRDR
ncbi:chromate transporter [Lichenihabitans sp. Uapishka_5]|uniref:chromate transporter n=1 Tax=Lichenihabitans sp. Uapishka_5 TaxID=3037302 RepID=UPI0029E7D822|nr:chromate transporter [Lichenihabitans sp. Uapishka_5]MDX7952772.1 chromate transporter [Lichenihabitans sp. Uapishka_5]